MYKQKQGFTLVELIVVITILAILGTIAIMAFSGYSKNARDSVRVTDISNIMKGVELYSLKAGNYPEPDEAVVYTGGTSSSIKQGKIGDLVSSNINISGDLVDPLTQEKYVYSVFGNSKYYQIGAEKENDQTLLIDSAYAESGKVIVKGNYMFDPSLPSLIVVPSSVTGSGIFDPSVCFVVDGGINTLSTCIETKSEMVLKNMDNNLVGYWDMETLTGTMLKDLSGNENNGVFSGGMIYSTALTGGLIGKGLDFNGVSDFINIYDNDSLDLTKTATFLVTFKSLGLSSDFLCTGQYGTLFSKRELGTNNAYQIYAESRPSMSFNNGYSGGWISRNDSEINYEFDKNYQIVVGFDNGLITQFLNGLKLKTSDTLYGTGDLYKTLNPNNGSITFGIRNSTCVFNGIIDDIKIYNRVLGDEEILQQAKIAGF